MMKLLLLIEGGYDEDERELVMGVDEDGEYWWLESVMVCYISVT